MAKVFMAQVYRQIYDDRLEDIKLAAQNGKQVVPYSFKEFSMDVRKNDLISTSTVIREKWDNAVADGVIAEYNGHYNTAWILYDKLQLVCHIPKNVCVSVCVPKQINTLTEARL